MTVATRLSPDLCKDDNLCNNDQPRETKFLWKKQLEFKKNRKI